MSPDCYFPFKIQKITKDMDAFCTKAGAEDQGGRCGGSDFEKSTEQLGDDSELCVACYVLVKQ